MEKISDLEVNLDGLQESSRSVEKILNEIINNDDMSIEEAKKQAALCLDAVNRYTGIANMNIRLLKEQALNMLKKVQSILEKSQGNDPILDEESDFEIN